MDVQQHPAMLVRQAGDADAALVAGILAEAFEDDPLLKWLFPDDRRRLALLSRYFLTIARSLYLRHREVYVADEGGAAMWLPPGTSPDSLPLATWLTLLWRMFLSHGFAGLNRARAVSDVMQANHPREPHFYLHAIGVRKSRQGQGVGSALLRHVVRRCDNEGKLAYLENSNPRNTPLYERHGFRVVSEWTAPGGPPLGFMLRRPEGAGG
jgi:ribosomal protein S18 acetylase RimI-like enzyme